MLDCIFDVDSVLDLNAFERQNKAEGLGMVSEEGTSEYDPQQLTVTHYLSSVIHTGGRIRNTHHQNH